MDAICRHYLTLALELDRHSRGFVDAYFGPPELKAKVEAGSPRPLDALAGDAHNLEAAIEATDYDPQRKDFLVRQTRAMSAVIRKLSGEELDFVQEVEQFFDITPTMVDESTFEAAHAEMNALIPGPGPLAERFASHRKKVELEPDRILPVFNLARREAQRRTLSLFDLPPGEEMTLHLVQDEPWSAYNWYLGEYRSRIDINTTLPVRADSTLPLIAHEAYPGHHTEHAVKEYELYQKQERGEHAVQLLLAPECVISEGIGDNAVRMIFDEQERIDFYRDELFPLAGLSHVDAEEQNHLRKAAEALRGVDGNAALLLHRDGRSPAEVQEYVEHYGLQTPQEASQILKFLTNPLFRSYVFNYAMGEALLAPLLEGPDAPANSYRLLSEPFTPTQVREWLFQRQEG
jgi:hypothetical protein